MAEPTPRIVQKLEQLNGLTFDDKEACLEALGSAARDRSLSVRWKAMAVLEKTGFQDGLHLAESALKDKSSMVRAAAAKCVGTLLENSGKEHPSLRMQLQDSDWVTRDDAQESLGAIGDKKALPLIATLLEDEERVVRSHCATVLADLGGKRYRKLLQARLRIEKDEHARAGLLTGLIRLGEKSLLLALLALLTSNDYLVRCATANYLSGISFDDDELDDVRKALRRAHRHSLYRGDKSTMQSVLKFLNEVRQ